MSVTKDPLLEIPGIGPNLAADLRDLGFTEPRELRNQDPERLFERLCTLREQRIDPCVLYAFRCAVYYSRTEDPEPELLQWWRWKNRRL